MSVRQFKDEDYRRLLVLRDGLRRFEHWSEQRARSAGITAAQHQLLLAVRGHESGRGPTIGELADHLLLRHHSAVELVKRAEQAGLVTKIADKDDLRTVRLELTKKANTVLRSLSVQHLAELDRLSNDLTPLWAGLGGPQRRGGRRKSWGPIRTKRLYEKPNRDDGTRVLVDRLWPRGVSKQDAPFDRWLPNVAPSTELRQWYAHQEARFPKFAERYRRELGDRHADELDELRSLMAEGPLTLLTATRDLSRSHVEVLADELNRLGVRRSGVRSSS